MDISSFQSYLLILFILLVIISIFVFRQFLKTRSEESNLVKFEQKGFEAINSASELYEFGSIQIKKRLYSQAIKTFLKAIKNSQNEPDEAKAIIENALGFCYAAQKEFKKAIKHYDTAIILLPEYVVAYNNLASAKQNLLEFEEAYNIYQKVLTIDPKNKTAIKKTNELKKRSTFAPFSETKNKGF